MIKLCYQIILIFILIFISSIATAQGPAKFNFQGVARNGNGNVIQSKNIALRFSVRTGTAIGPVDYQESRSVLTDSFGVFNAIIGGSGIINSTGSLGAVVWTTGSKFLQVEIDTANTNAFINLGATQLLSVPYALYSNNSASAGYATSSGNYFFEATYRMKSDTLKDGEHTLIFPNTTYNRNYVEVTLDNLGIPIYNLLKPVYDSTNGIFTAPENGIYQFDFEVISFDGGAANGHVFFLSKNGIKVRVIDAFGLETNPPYKYSLYERWEHSSFHNRLKLQSGDQISITYIAKYSIDFPSPLYFPLTYPIDYGSPVATFNYFSGYKIN